MPCQFPVDPFLRQASIAVKHGKKDQESVGAYPKINVPSIENVNLLVQIKELFEDFDRFGKDSRSN